MRPVFEYLDYRRYLRDAFEERRSRDTNLTYRRLGETLGLDGSNFHKIVLGRSHLPIRCQARVVEYLGLSGRESEYFLLLLAFARERGAKARMEILERAKLLQDVDRRTLEDRELLFYRDWWISVIRLLLEVNGGQAVAERLAGQVAPPIRTEQAQEAMDLLVELGMVKRIGSGRWKLAEPHLTAGGAEKAKAIHAYQKQILSLATDALAKTPQAERDVSTLTVPVDDQSFAAIRDILRECRRQIQKQADSTEEPKRVMQLAMAFFPVSRKQGATP